jgi:IS30 family transposase
MSDAKRALLWRMWADGRSFSQISVAVGHPPGSIFTIVKQTGGYVPAARKRRDNHLRLAEREEVSRGLARGDSIRKIARSIGRAPSTVSREVARNRGAKHFRAIDADDRAWRRARRPKACLLAGDPELRDYVADRLSQDWSPGQIAGTLAKHQPLGAGVTVSHETIYKTLFVQARGVLAKELQKHLRTRRPTRRNIHNTVTGQWRSQIRDAVSISERPAEVEDRAIPGHWEGDLLLGRHWTQVATVVERSTRFTVLVQLDGRDMATVTEGLTREMVKLPERVRKSLTWDRGMELAGHKHVAAGTGLDVYFADPRSPWQRGTNENTNGLLRQYLPKGQSVGHLTQADLDAIALKLNTRPRKTLDFDTPAHRMAALLR